MPPHVIEEAYIDAVLELTDEPALGKEKCHQLLEEIQNVASSRIEEFVRKACLDRWPAADSDAAIIIYEEEAWERVFDDLELEDESTRSVLREIHSYQSRDVLFRKIIQGQDTRHDPIGIGRSTPDYWEPYPDPLLIQKDDHFALGQKAQFWDFQFLLQEGLSPAEALDYIAIQQQDLTQVDWADIRGISHQAVSKNVRQAIDGFNRHDRGIDWDWSGAEEDSETDDWRAFSSDDESDVDVDWSEKSTSLDSDFEERLDAWRERKEERSEEWGSLGPESETADIGGSFGGDQRRDEQTENSTTPETVVDWDAIAAERSFSAEEYETAWREMLDELTGVHHPFLDTLADDLGPEAARRIAVTYAESTALTESQMEQIASAVEQRLQS